MLVGGGRITAMVDVPDGGAQGVLFAIGDWNGGLAAYVADGALHVTVATPGATIRVACAGRVPPGPHNLGCALLSGPAGVRVEALIDDVVVGTGDSEHSLPFTWQHGQEGTAGRLT